MKSAAIGWNWAVFCGRFAFQWLRNIYSIRVNHSLCWTSTCAHSLAVYRFARIGIFYQCVVLALLFVDSVRAQQTTYDMGKGDCTPAEIAEIARQFQPKEIHYTGGQFHNEEFSYRLYAPPTVEKGKKYPLMLWLHGAGDLWDREQQLIYLERALIKYSRKHGPFLGFVLRPDNSEHGWFSGPVEQDDDLLTVASAILKRTIEEYPIDEDRVVLIGISSGGTAAWEMGMRNPGRFAAIAPIASGASDTSRAAYLVGTPIWAFNSRYDRVADINDVRNSVSAVEAAGGHAKLTEIPSDRHGAWIPAIDDYDVLDWLIARRRGEWSWRPFLQSVDWQHVFLIAGVCVLSVLVGWHEIRRRRKLRKETHAGGEGEFSSDARLPDFDQLIGKEL